MSLNTESNIWCSLATYELGLTLSTLTSAVSAESSGTALVLEFAEVLEPELPRLGALALSIYDNSTALISVDLPQIVHEGNELILRLVSLIDRFRHYPVSH